MISREQFLEDGGRRAKRLLADWDKGAFFNISRVSDMRVNKKRCLEFRVTNAETGVQIWVPDPYIRRVNNTPPCVIQPRSGWGGLRGVGLHRVLLTVCV